MYNNLPNKISEIPPELQKIKRYGSIAEFYADYIVFVLEKYNKAMDRILICEEIEKELAKDFTWTFYKDNHTCVEQCRDRTHETIYLKVHAALKLLIDEGRCIKSGGEKSIFYSLVKTVPVGNIAPMVVQQPESPDSVQQAEFEKRVKLIRKKVTQPVQSAPKPLKVSPLTLNNGRYKVVIENYYETISFKHIEVFFRLGFDLLLKGKPGTGKTLDLLYYAYRHDLDCFHITFTEDLATWNVLGRSSLVTTFADIQNYAKENNLEIVEATQQIFKQTWVYGTVALACKNAEQGIPTMLIMDEINFASPSISAGVLNMVLNDHKLVIPDTGEIIKWKKEDLTIGATINPDLVGTLDLNEALESRFFKYEYEEPDYEAIVRTVLGKKPSDNLCKIYEAMLASALSRSIGLREIITWTRLEQSLAPLEKGVQNKFHPLLIKAIREQLVEGDRLQLDALLTGL